MQRNLQNEFFTQQIFFIGGKLGQSWLLSDFVAICAASAGTSEPVYLWKEPLLPVNLQKALDHLCIAFN